MGKMHTNFNIGYDGKVSYRFWHEDGEGIVWDTGSVDGGKRHIELVTRAAERCQAIEAAIAHLDWPT